MKRRYTIPFIIQILLLHLVQLSFAQSASRISGHITDSEGKALQGISVYLQGTQKGALTDSTGNYHIENIVPGNYEIKVHGIGYTDQSKKMNLQPGQNATIHFRLQEDAISQKSVVVNGKTRTREVKEQAYNVTAINAAELHNTNQDINQVLNKTTGVRVREDGGLGSNFSFSLNGFSGRQVKFFLDGVPMDNFGSSLTLNNIPVNLVERIEVYKGVVPVHLGSDALGGAVNIVTNQKTGSYLDASYSFGSFNTHRAAVNSRYMSDSSGFMLNASAFYNYSDNNYQVDAAIPDRNTGKVNGTTRVRRFHDGYESGTLILETGVYNKKYADKMLIGLIASGNEKEIQHGMIMEEVYGEVRTKDRTLMPTLKYRKSDLLIKGLTLTAYASYNTGKYTVIDTGSRSYDWNGNYKTNNDPKIGEAAWEKSMFLFKDENVLLTGNLGYKLSKKHSFSFNYTQNIFSRVGEDSLSQDPVAFKAPNIIDKKIMGLAYKLDLLGGRFTTTLFAKYFMLNGVTYSDEYGDYTDKKQTTFNRPGAGIATAYHLSRALQLKASFENTYRLPEGYEMFGNGLLLLTNPELLPEKSNNLNIGALAGKYFSKHRLSMEGNYFYRDAENLIRLDGAGLTSQYVNLRNARTQGVEGEIKYEYNHTLFFGINATYQNIINTAKFEPPGSNRISYIYLDRLPNIPYLYGNAEAGVRIKNVYGKRSFLSINWWCNYVEEYFLKWPSMGDRSSKFTIPRQVVQNVSLTSSFKSGRYNLSLECRNLLDSKVYDNFRLQKPGRAFYIKARYFISKHQNTKY